MCSPDPLSTLYLKALDGISEAEGDSPLHGKHLTMKFLLLLIVAVTSLQAEDENVMGNRLRKVLPIFQVVK